MEQVNHRWHGSTAGVSITKCCTTALFVLTVTLPQSQVIGKLDTYRIEKNLVEQLIISM